MKIDYVYPHAPNDWEGASFARTLRKQGLLGTAYTVTHQGADELLRRLRHSTADAIIFAGADQHMTWLHADPARADAVRALPQTTLCICGEPIVGNTLRWTPSRALSAVACFDRIAYAYEGDRAFFEEAAGRDRTSLCMFAVDPEIFEIRRPVRERRNRVLFTGKITDFGLGMSEIYSRRRQLAAHLAATGEADIIYNPASTWEQFVTLLNEYSAYIILPGLGEGIDGFSRKVFEVLACGNLMLHTAQSPGSLAGHLFRDGTHCYYYDATVPSSMTALIDSLRSLSADTIESIAMAGNQAVMDEHTLDRRIRAIVEFCRTGTPIHAWKSQ